MTELEQLTALCEQLGAARAQAATMAAQLLKRAGQLAVERGIAREAALSHLLNLLVKGHAGEVPKEFSGPGENPPATESKPPNA
ncbi:MAG: hypothetical protein Q7S40_25380 [Opitutaceae bacterium]|nr:hypothetical protein [Opitutaceae bacterium]